MTRPAMSHEPHPAVDVGGQNSTTGPEIWTCGGVIGKLMRPDAYFAVSQGEVEKIDRRLGALLEWFYCSSQEDADRLVSGYESRGPLT